MKRRKSFVFKVYEKSALQNVETHARNFFKTCFYYEERGNMLFLDANAFYSYYGRKKLGMTSSPIDEDDLCMFLDNHKEKSLPTSVFIEIVTHFRDNPNTLLKLMKFREQKKLPLYNNIPDYVIDCDEITIVSLEAGFFGEQGVRRYAQKLLEKKIEIETKFTFLFYEITRDLYAKYKLDQNTVLSNQQKEIVLKILTHDQFKRYGSIVKGTIEAALRDGYKNNKEQNIHKKQYIKELDRACLTIDLMITGFSSAVQSETNIVDDIQTTYQKKKAKGLDGSDNTMNVIVDAIKEDIVFLNQAKTVIAEMFIKGRYSPSQRRYIKEVMFEAWYERGQKFRKNDIFDMLCVGCLDYVDKSTTKNVLLDKSSYVITFDCTMKEFLRSVRPANIDLIDSIGRF